jgi:hypothetical protein
MRASLSSPILQPLLDQLSSEPRLLIPVGLPYSYQERLVIEKKPIAKS